MNKSSDQGKRSAKFVIIDTQTAVPSSVQVGFTNVKQLEQLLDTADAKGVKTKSVPATPKAGISLGKEELARRRIIHPGMKNAEVMNAFRSLRHSLAAKMKRANSVILVSAVNKGGGASFTAINLATAFTFEHGRHALLVECNLGNPSLARTLGVEASVGLYDYLVENENDIGKLIYPTSIPRLSLVPCGGEGIRDENLVEFFTSQRMIQFLYEVRNRYEDRTVVLDAAPVLESTDTKVLAGISDLVVVALPYKGATPNRVNKTIEEFGRDNISGFVMVN